MAAFYQEITGNSLMLYDLGSFVSLVTRREE